VLCFIALCDWGNFKRVGGENQRERDLSLVSSVL
jgi:hypothetical protein